MALIKGLTAVSNLSATRGVGHEGVCVVGELVGGVFRCQEKSVVVRRTHPWGRVAAAGRDRRHAVLETRHEGPATGGHTVEEGREVQVHHGKAPGHVRGGEGAGVVDRHVEQRPAKFIPLRPHVQDDQVVVDGL
jgi:hypothetical protein